MMRHLRHIFSVLWLLCMSSGYAGCLDAPQLRGVNLSGAEFNSKNLPGLRHKNYTYPSRNDLAYFKAAGMNVIRLPFRWERVQRQTFAPLDPGELAQLRQLVGWATELDMCVILDLHNYGAYFGRPIGSAEVPAAAFADVWLRLHQAFGNPDTTAFGLMNEPSAITVPQWMTLAQHTVLALRRAGSKNLILVGSGRWSGAHEFAKPFDGVTATEAFRSFIDPGHNFAIELHQYTDPNYAGTGSQCISAERLEAIMTGVSAWAKQEKKRLFLGEFGVGRSGECLAALQVLLASMQVQDIWLGWTYWSAGPWWGNYPLSIQPNHGIDAPQMEVLRRYLE
ncbi:glycoside hydrolase family 5 protein [Rhodoferax sp. U2-2l]|uniref:glycoside hydrolase family 5 protein n=1 Tax=Rhodoferax sp. U2-2l TaxID=2884000 RepID=UPI001D0AB448|nr:glycoside hydrolase family 5 protein [Rhodoferax sp. U2-2l]MCB8746899.1 glycoside hydrolase family 5 protein [Rhodoferax sp. U2-2l]